MENNFDFAHPKDIAFLKQKANNNFWCEKNLTVQEYPNAIVGSGWNEGGVWQENGEFIQHTYFNCSPLFAMQNKPKVLDSINESVVFVGLFTGTWGHEITDHLKHLWLYFDEHYAHLKNLRWVYSCVFGNTQISNYYWTMLKSMGINKKLERITGATQFKSIFVPDDSIFFDQTKGIYQITPTYFSMIKRIAKQPLPENPQHFQKVYFSRVRFESVDKVKDFNEAALENVFKNQGFTIIYPDELDFLTEVQILQHCKVFAATEGSIAHNLLFCQEGTTAIILKKCRQLAIHQMPINAIQKAKVYFINAGFSPLADYSAFWFGGPFFMYQTKELSRFFHLNYPGFPYFKFCQYILRFCLYRLRQFWFKIDHRYFALTHPLRAQLKIGTKIKNVLKYVRFLGKKSN